VQCICRQGVAVETGWQQQALELHPAGERGGASDCAPHAQAARAPPRAGRRRRGGHGGCCRGKRCASRSGRSGRCAAERGAARADGRGCSAGPAARDARSTRARRPAAAGAGQGRARDAGEHAGCQRSGGRRSYGPRRG